MAYSTCPKCDNQSFELTTNSPRGSNYKMSFIQCSKCGAVVGVTEFMNIGYKIEELEKKINSLRPSSDLSVINSSLEIINRNLQILYQAVEKLQPKTKPKLD